MSKARRSKRSKRTTDHFTFEDDENNGRPTKVPRATTRKVNAPIIELSSDDDDEEHKSTIFKVTKKSVKSEPDEEDLSEDDVETATNRKTSVVALKYQAGALFAVRNVDCNTHQPKGLKNGTSSKKAKTGASGPRQAQDESSRKPASKKTSAIIKPTQSETSTDLKTQESDNDPIQESKETETTSLAKPEQFVSKPAAKQVHSKISAQAKPKESPTESKGKTTIQPGATVSSKLAKPTPMIAAFTAVTEAPIVMYDSDEEPPKDESLTWRGDPSVTLSDWTIEIVSDDTVDTYHVHKVILSYGARRSKYFLNLFCRGSRYTELESNTSRIQMDALAAKAFPQLLDFIYGKEELDINADTACALHFLGSYFEMPQLRWKAKQFWKKDLRLFNATTYYQHAQVFHDDKILDGVTDIFAKNIMEIKPSSLIIEISDAEFWTSLIAKVDLYASEPNAKVASGQETDEKAAAMLKPGEASAAPATDKSALQNHLSELIAQFAMDHVDDLDLATFRALAAPEKLPIVSKKAALSLMEVEEAILSKTSDKGSLILLDRCVAAIASDWQGMGGVIEPSFKKMKRPFLAKLLEKSLENASNDCQKAVKAKADADKEHAKEKRQLKEELSEMKSSRDLYQRLSRTRRGELREAQSALAAAQLELAQLRSLDPASMRPSPNARRNRRWERTPSPDSRCPRMGRR